MYERQFFAAFHMYKKGVLLQHTLGVYFYILIAAVVLIWLFKRLNLPPILAYLAVGVLAGSDGFSWLQHSEQIHFVAELGIVFLLFSLGLEFSVPRLMAMRHIVFGVGAMQVVLTTLVVMLLLWLFGLTLLAAFSIGSLVALSSTAIVIKQVSGSPIFRSRQGQLAIGVLLFQDIAVVPLLIALPLLANGAEQTLWLTILLALGKGTLVIALLMAIGKWVLPKVFNEVALTRSDELFVLTTLLVALFAGALTYIFGLSMALGAFLAGMMLGESEYRHQLEADIRPFRDILMGLFFITIGMQLDMGFVLANAQWVLLGLVAVLFLKVLITFMVTKIAGESAKSALGTALMLCQMGEFSFVLISLALNYTLVDGTHASLLLAVGVLSMAITPYLIDNSYQFSTSFINRFFPTKENKAEFEHNSTGKFEGFNQHVVICGYGRVGQTVGRFLKAEAIPFIAIDSDAIRVKEAQAAGENIHFGQSKQKEILKGANIESSRLLIITFADKETALAIVNSAKQLAPKVKILVRMRDDRYLSELKDSGITEVVPEKLEASLMLVSHVLYLTGVPVRRILKRVQGERRNRYGLLHGYFPGDSTQMSPDEIDRLEFLHAIAITEDAYARGKSLAALDLQKRRVDITGLRRDGAEIPSPSDDTVLLAQDILIVRGKPRRVERAERYLLEGS